MKLSAALCLLLAVLFVHLATAQPPAPNWPRLREFEGEYDYQRGATLQMAASPCDGQLYALIAGARYPLYALPMPDAFRNSGHDTVRFQRDAAGRVLSYTVGGQRFRRRPGTVAFPAAMWYPRVLAAGSPFAYKYTPPPARPDGLPVGTLRGTGLSPARLDTLVSKIVAGAYPDVHSVLILHRGRLVFEEYFYEYTRETLHPLRSATKSVISALTGLGVAQGLLTLNTSVPGRFPEYHLAHDSSPKQAITVEDLLTNQSGLDCDIAEEHSPGNETLMGASADWVRFTLNLPQREAPGRVGRYCSGNPIVLGRLLEKQASQPLPAYARQRLFAPLGITQFDWRFQPDSSSAETFCQLSLRPRDMAKLGQLYLDHGRWHGRPLLPAAWVAASLTKHATVQGVDYGYLWWLKHLDANGTRYYGAAAQGNGGQRITVWPAQELVVVVTGGSYNRQSPSDELIAKCILAAFNPKYGRGGRGAGCR